MKLPFEFGKPFINYSEEDISIMVEIDLRDIVDPYAYHDFPSLVDIFLREEDLLNLKQIIDDRLKQIRSMEEDSDEK